MDQRGERASAPSLSTSRAAKDRLGPSTDLWSAIMAERRAAGERTGPGAARCGWIARPVPPRADDI